MQTTPTAMLPAFERRGKYPPAGSGYGWIGAGMAMVLVGGLVLDTWAHNHGRVDATFFTPWHGILYGGMGLAAAFLMVSMLRFHARGYAWPHVLPAGYGLSLLGVVLFAAGGVLDLIWHTLFGAEVNIETLLSPTHLLALGGVLSVAGPLRAAWQRLPAGSIPRGGKTCRRANHAPASRSSSTT